MTRNVLLEYADEHVSTTSSKLHQLESLAVLSTQQPPVFAAAAAAAAAMQQQQERKLVRRKLNGGGGGGLGVLLHSQWRRRQASQQQQSEPEPEHAIYFLLTNHSSNNLTNVKVMTSNNSTLSYNSNNNKNTTTITSSTPYSSSSSNNNMDDTTPSAAADAAAMNNSTSSSSSSNATSSTSSSSTTYNNSSEIVRQTLRVYGSMFLGSLVLFLLLRWIFPKFFSIRSWVKSTYSPLAAASVTTSLSSSVSSSSSSTRSSTSTSSFSWCSRILSPLISIYTISDADLLHYCSMDAVCFIRALYCGRRIALFGCCNALWLIPLYATAADFPIKTSSISIHSSHIDPFVLISVGNIPSSSSKRFIGTILATYITFGYVMYLIRKEYQWFIQQRHIYLSQHQQVRNYTIYVSGIPSNYRSSYALRQFFQLPYHTNPKKNDSHENSNSMVVEAHIAMDTPQLDQKVLRRDGIIQRLEHIVAMEQKQSRTITQVQWNWSYLQTYLVTSFWKRHGTITTICTSRNQHNSSYHHDPSSVGKSSSFPSQVLLERVESVRLLQNELYQLNRDISSTIHAIKAKNDPYRCHLTRLPAIRNTNHQDGLLWFHEENDDSNDEDESCDDSSDHIGNNRKNGNNNEQQQDDDHTNQPFELLVDTSDENNFHEESFHHPSRTDCSTNGTITKVVHSSLDSSDHHLLQAEVVELMNDETIDNDDANNKLSMEIKLSATASESQLIDIANEVESRQPSDSSIQQHQEPHYHQEGESTIQWQHGNELRQAPSMGNEEDYDYHNNSKQGSALEKDPSTMQEDNDDEYNNSISRNNKSNNSSQASGLSAVPPSPTGRTNNIRSSIKMGSKAFGETSGNLGHTLVTAGSKGLQTAKDVGTKGLQTAKQVGTIGLETAKQVGTKGLETAKQVSGHVIKTASNHGVKGIKKVHKVGTELVTSAGAVLPILLTKSEGEPREGGFVVFRNLFATQAALQMLQSPTPYSMQIHPAPDPHDVYWRNVGMPARAIRTGRWAAMGSTAVLCFFYSFPIAFISSLTNISTLKQVLPKVGHLIEVYPKLEIVIALMAPLLLLIINEIFLPAVLRYFSSWEGHVSSSKLGFALFIKLGWFQIIQTFFVSAISGSITAELQNILHDPQRIINLLASSLPTRSSFFTQILLTQTFLLTSIQLLRILPLGMALLRRLIGPNLTARERRRKWGVLYSLEEPPPFGLAETFAQLILYYIVLLVYTTIAPVISFFIVFCFIILEGGYRYQFVHNYPIEGDTGGLLFQGFLYFLQASMVIAQLTLIGLMALKQSIYAGPALGPLLAVTVLFIMYINSQHSHVSLYLPTSLCHGDTNENSPDNILSQRHESNHNSGHVPDKHIPIVPATDDPMDFVKGQYLQPSLQNLSLEPNYNDNSDDDEKDGHHNKRNDNHIDDSERGSQSHLRRRRQQQQQQEESDYVNETPV